MSYWNSFAKGFKEFTTEVLKEEDDDVEEVSNKPKLPQKQQTNQQVIDELQQNIQEKNEYIRKMQEEFQNQMNIKEKQFNDMVNSKDEEIKILKKQLLSTSTNKTGLVIFNSKNRGNYYNQGNC
jgi:TolA-binding protein